jgi:Ca-activated chloride channel family protein
MTARMVSVVVLTLLLTFVGHAQQDGIAPPPTRADMPTLRITSPLGRTGAPATVRIVAQIQWPSGADMRPLQVRFLVDGSLVGTVDSGPPYAVTWADDNPFEAREIVVEAESDGVVVRDKVFLPPYEIADETEVASIVVDAGVYDDAGHSIANLNESAFGVSENGEPQKIDLFTRETLPSTVVLLVDSSQSMAQRMNAVRKATEFFAQNLGKHDKIIVAPFNHRVGVITGPTDDVKTTTEAIESIKAGGGTAILNAIDETATLLHGVEGRRAIILITDGFDENSTVDVQAAVQKAQAEQVTIYSVAVGGISGVSLHGEATFRKVADATGGRAFFPWREIDLLGVVREIVNDENSRYLITYTPTNQTKDGAWRAITVDVPKGYHARARAGYEAALPPPIRPQIEFRVTDKFRKYANVTAEDVEVIEDGVRQSVDTFQEAVDPVSIAMLLDASGSMTRSAEIVRQTAREFVSSVRPEDSLSLITFADQPFVEHALGKTRQYTFDAIDKYKPAGGTALNDALWGGLQQLKVVPGRRAVVVLTDGRDENRNSNGPGSAHTIEDVVQLAREVGATIFPIGLGTRVDKEFLARLAKLSGGDAYFPTDPEQLAEQFHGIIENLRQRYLLSYTSTNAKRDGAWRHVDIKPRVDSLIVTTGGGYFAPSR